MYNAQYMAFLSFQVLTLSTTFQQLKLPITSPQKSNISLKTNILHLQTNTTISNLTRSLLTSTQPTKIPKQKHRELTPTSNFPFVSSRCAAFSRPVSCAALRMDRSWESAASLPPRRNVVPGRLFRDVDSTTVWWEQRSADLEKTTNPWKVR